MAVMGAGTGTVGHKGKVTGSLEEVTPEPKQMEIIRSWHQPAPLWGCLL